MILLPPSHHESIKNMKRGADLPRLLMEAVRSALVM